MTAPKITVVGSYNTDLTTFTPRMPQPGETILGNGFATGPGGKGSNQAVAAARLGGAVTFVGRVGQDMYADMAIKVWQAEGIRTDYVIQDAEQHTGLATIIVDDAGENMIVVASGANWRVTSADVDNAEAAIAESAVLLLQLEVPMPAVVRALEVAKAHNVTTILNPAPGQALDPSLLALVDVITPNQGEAALITGADFDSAADAAYRLREVGAKSVVMTLGSQGVLLAGEDGSAAQTFPAFTVQAVDTTGAGDAFNGALAVSLAEGGPLADAIRFASAAAALSVTRPGATDAMPSRAEVDAFLAQQAG